MRNLSLIFFFPHLYVHCLLHSRGQTALLRPFLVFFGVDFINVLLLLTTQCSLLVHRNCATHQQAQKLTKSRAKIDGMTSNYGTIEDISFRLMGGYTVIRSNPRCSKYSSLTRVYSSWWSLKSKHKWAHGRLRIVRMNDFTVLIQYKVYSFLYIFFKFGFFVIILLLN